MIPELLPWLIASSVALGVLGLGGLVYGYFLQAQRKIQRQRRFAQMERMLSPGAADLAVAKDGEELSLPEKLVWFFSGHVPNAQSAEQDSEERGLLIRSGFRGVNAVLVFQVVRWLLLAITVLGFSIYALAAGGGNAWLRTLAAAIVAYLLPRYILRYLAHRRSQSMGEEIPVFIDFLRMMHSVGISFEQSINIFAENSRLGLPVLSSELAAVALAIRSGRSRTDALQLMARQMDVDDLSELVALICHTDYYGAAVQEPLRQFSMRLTERKRFQMQEYVGKLATRMVMVMVVFLLPALIIVTAGPGFISVFKALGGMT